MDTLILSVAAGGGHLHAAQAIKEYILMDDASSKVEVIDTLRYINPLLDKMIIGSYLKTIKVSPSLFGRLYNHAENDEGLATVSNKINELMADKLLPFIKNFNPKIIIATHPFPLEMITILKKKGLINIPLITILTDYAPHTFWIHNGVDAYIVSNIDMKKEMVSRGVLENIIFDIGIPILSDFTKKYDRKEILSSLNLDPYKKTILIMGGSLGIGKISEIYNELCKVDLEIQIIVITGNNKKLYSELINLKTDSKKETRIIGYTNEVTKYMQGSDLLLTKPGGLTITEALVSNIPLAIFCPIPGQEQKNADFLLRHNLAITLNDGKNCKDIINNLLRSEEKLKDMKNNCTIYSKPKVGEDLIRIIKKFANKTLREAAAEISKGKGK